MLAVGSESAIASRLESLDTPFDDSTSDDFSSITTPWTRSTLGESVDVDTDDLDYSRLISVLYFEPFMPIFHSVSAAFASFTTPHYCGSVG